MNAFSTPRCCYSSDSFAQPRANVDAIAERQPFVKAELEYKEQLRLYRNSRLAAPEEYPGVSGEERGVLGGEWNAPPEYEIDYDV